MYLNELLCTVTLPCESWHQCYENGSNGNERLV